MGILPHNAPGGNLQASPQIDSLTQLASNWVLNTRNFKPSEVAWATLNLSNVGQRFLGQAVPGLKQVGPPC